MWVLDTFNHYIYWFREIANIDIKGMVFQKNGIVRGGRWSKSEMIHIIKTEPEKRFKEVDFNNLTKKRKRMIIDGIFNYDF